MAGTLGNCGFLADDGLLLPYISTPLCQLVGDLGRHCQVLPSKLTACPVSGEGQLPSTLDSLQVGLSSSHRTKTRGLGAGGSPFWGFRDSTLNPHSCTAPPRRPSFHRPCLLQKAGIIHVTKL